MKISILLIFIYLLSTTNLSWSKKSTDDRKWFPFPFRLPKPPPQVEQFFIQIPVHAKNFLDNILPKPLRNLFPNIKPLDLDNLQGVESRSNHVSREMPIRQGPAPGVSSDVERGLLQGGGRDVIKNWERQFSNTSAGLDTDANFFSGFLNGFKEHVKAIYPGTQWCGDGNRSRSYEELGLFFKTDSCCREHDSCPEFIDREDVRYGLYNGGLFTRSHCDCDKEFYECLKEADDMISGQIGTAYFTALGPQCFKLEKPIVDCKIKVGLTNRCIEYIFNDNSTEKIYQWFDNPEF